MKLRDNFWLALSALRGNPLRSFLTALGVIIGVSAVITMVSIGEGAKAQVTGQIQALGSNLLMVMPGRMGRGRTAGAMGSGTALTDRVLPVLSALPSVRRVAPETGGQREVTYNSQSLITSVIGTNEDYPAVRNLTLAQGVFFTPEDVRGARRVAVLGSEIVSELFAGQDPVGQRIKIGRVKFTVIGVIAAKGQSGFMSNDDVVYVPLAAAQRRLLGHDRLRMIYVEARSEALMERASAEVNAALLRELEDEEAFTIRNQAEIMDLAADATQTLTLLLAGIAGLSLLVGGIGIMNIMLVSVTERIREIGLRKAIGAREDEILLQFLLEAATLSLVGGIIGTILGAAGSSVLSASFGFPAVISTQAVLMSFGLSLSIGLFFGVYPARKASRLDPIAALRHD
ncbi:MAG: ABC transporter permease [Patescibacteria group bacterium]